MSLPATIRVKVSSESTEVSVTPVVSLEMPADELVLHILGVTGKLPERVREILQRGTLIAGASRFRWNALTVEDVAVQEFLQRFPDAEPSRPFDARRCVEIVLRSGERGQRRDVSISKEAATKRRWFQRKNCWDVLLAALPNPGYRDYSYKESADVYRVVPSAEQRMAVQNALGLLTFSFTLPAVDAIDLYVPRA